MPDGNLELGLIAQQSVQTRATEQPVEGGPFGSSTVDVMSWLTQAGALVPAWWSKGRDRRLRYFWRGNDALASAMYTMQTKLTSIPFRVEPRDGSVQSHVRLAADYQANLENMTGFGKGWVQGMAPALEDLFGQDNGMFLEVVGEGPKDGPIKGAALGIAPIDAARCVRTRSPEWPVYYHDYRGERFKLHHTRVIHVAQMPSAIEEMNGVGFCAASRSIMAAQNLLDMATYDQENLGSRPKSRVLVAKKGLTLDDVMLAFRMAEQSADAQGLTRYAKTTVIAPKRAAANAEIDLESLDLSGPPPGYNRQESTTIAVYILAWAFGVDAREFWPATTTGATKADALVQHMKARGKAIGNTLAVLEQEINRKFLPPALKITFDVQDDDEDQQRAAIQDARSTTIDRDLKGKVYDVRTARLSMLQDEHLSQTQFDDLELSDGRLPGGEDVLALFYSTDPVLSKLLDLSDAEDEPVPAAPEPPKPEPTAPEPPARGRRNPSVPGRPQVVMRSF